MFIFDKPLEQVTETDLKALVESKIPESLFLDYKREYHGNSDANKKELLKDVSSFANANGGHLLMGISEKDQLPVDIIGIEDADIIGQKVRSLCATSIQENIQGLKVIPIPLEDGKHVLAIEIPQSIRQPHMVSLGKHKSFWKRQDDHIFPLNMEDIRYLCVAGNQLMEKSKQVLHDLNEELSQRDNRGVNVQLAILPLYLRDNNIDTTQEELKSRLQKYNNYSPRPHDSRSLINFVQHFMYGIEGMSYGKARDDYRVNVQIYHSGLIHVFYRQDWHANRGEGGVDAEYYIHGPILVDYINNLLSFGKDIYKYCNISGPFRVSIGFSGINKLKLFSRPGDFELEFGGPLDTRKVIVPYQNVANLDDLNRVASLVSDAIWRSYHFDKCPYYNEKAEYILRR